MANLSLKMTQAAYVALSKMHEDPTAQGATQIVSALRYFFALDQFVKQFGRACNTRSKEDKAKFNEFVGNFCHISDSKGVKYYTTNFYLPLKEHNGDYNTGSNFYSAGQVKVSLQNNGAELVYPVRGDFPLFKIKEGELYLDTSFYSNVSHFLPTPEVRIALAVWLARYMTLNIDKEDLSGQNLYNGLKEALSKRYSENLVSILFENELKCVEVLNSYPISYTPKQCVVFEPKQIESLFPEFTINNQPIETPIIDKKELADELKQGFIAYFANYLRLSTGKMDSTSKVDFYLALYEKHIAIPIKEKFPEFTSVFTYSDVTSLNNFLLRVSKEMPKLSILLEDKWPSEKENQTLNYYSWTMIRHYRNFLELLKILHRVSISINPALHQLHCLTDKDSTSNYSQYLAAMRTKPFLLLAGFSGTGKSRLVKEMAFASCPPSLRDADSVSPGNYCMIEVKPNWHDSSELIGYVSHIGKNPHYIVTPFINFLIKAFHNPEVPFFVCLDEMNLAPVEQYFAEFLSVLESRKLVNNFIVSEPLIKAEYTRDYIDDFIAAYTGKKKETTEYSTTATSDPAPSYHTAIFDEIKENGLRLPSNLIVVGTVNMDETTYQFSRKVIDRAMTIEMNEVDFNAMFTQQVDTLKYRDVYEKAENFLPKFTEAKDALNALDEEDAAYLKEELPKVLKDLDATLANTPFRIAYRVQNELILYFAALREERPDDEASALLTSAVDDILMMKVLPRIEGGEDLLGDNDKGRGPLSKLFDFTHEFYPKSHAKVVEMQGRLKANHFSSFWQ